VMYTVVSGSPCWSGEESTHRELSPCVWYLFWIVLRGRFFFGKLVVALTLQESRMRLRVDPSLLVDVTFFSPLINARGGVSHIVSFVPSASRSPPLMDPCNRRSSSLHGGRGRVVLCLGRSKALTLEFVFLSFTTL
jgi:hypothetical protein